MFYNFAIPLYTKLFLEQLNKNLELLNNAKLYLIEDLYINICFFNKNFSNDAIDCKNSFFPGIIKADLSDHYPIFCTIDAVARYRTSNTKSMSRYFKEISLILIAIYFVITCINRFVSFFKNNFDVNFTNFNNLFSDFINIIRSIIDFHASLKKLSRKQLKLN